MMTRRTLRAVAVLAVLLAVAVGYFVGVTTSAGNVTTLPPCGGGMRASHTLRAGGSQAIDQGTISVVSLPDRVAALAGAALDGPDHVEPLLHTQHGSVRLHVFTGGQSLPLHLHEASDVAILVLEGQPTVELAFRPSGNLAASDQAVEAGWLVHAPPYTGHGFDQSSSRHPLALLVFSAPPASTGTYVSATDERLRLGSKPTLSDLAADDDAPTTWINGRLTTTAITAETEVTAPYGPLALYVIRGRGTIRADASYALGPGDFVTIPRRQATKVTPAGREPVVLLRFRPRTVSARPILEEGTKRYSQDDEELIIRQFFDDRTGGVFLDVGAGHYRRYSTTYYLERHLGWSGVAVDALGEYAAGYAEHRQATTFVNYLVTDETRGPTTFFRAERFPEVSSTSRDLAAAQAQRHRGDDSITALEVPTITLTELLDQLRIEHLDFLSMDIEEHEPAALAGLDIDRFRPELACVEAHPAVRDRIYRYFVDHGYVRLDEYFAYDRFNWYFTPRSE